MSLLGFNTFTLQLQGAISHGEHPSTPVMHTGFPFWHGRLQFSSVSQLCPTLCDPMDCSTPGFPVLRQFWEFTQTHAHRVDDAIQLFHPLSPPSPLTFNLSQHQGLFKRVSSSHQMGKVLVFQLQHQSSQ